MNNNNNDTDKSQELPLVISEQLVSVFCLFSDRKQAYMYEMQQVPEGFSPLFGG